jgi:hypothetical protein
MANSFIVIKVHTDLLGRGIMEENAYHWGPFAETWSDATFASATHVSACMA